MRVDSGLSSANSLQMLKAQQAWEARRAAKNQTAAPQASQPALKIEVSVAAPTVAPTGSISPQWERTVREVQDIAARSGFIGVTEQDIRQAYSRGESLLADYRV